MKRLLKASAAFALATTLIFSGAGMASATDEATPAPEVSAEVQAPAETSTVEEAVVTPEVAAPAPAEAVEAPVVETAPAEPQVEVITTDAQPQAPPAQARTQGGSDSATTYTVDANGVTLASGETFKANGHVNITANKPSKNIHFDPNNNQPGGAWIGKSNIPWSAFGLTGDFCVSWVQVDGYNEHFGEGGQAPFCTNPPFVVKEVCATWETKSVSKDWPQTILSKDCNFVPEQRCEPYKIQFDKYWIRDAKDQAYFDSLKGLNSSADDQSLEPHDYYLKTIPAKDCSPVVVTLPELPVLPPTCDAAGSLPWTTNPAAQNPNGYEFPGQGFRVYLDKAYTGPGTYVATLQKIGAGFDPKFPYGTKVTGNTKQTLTVLPATGFQSEDSTQPCYEAPTPANPKADITAVCGAADITLTNPVVKDWAQITASYIVNVDGKFYGAYAVAAGESETVKLTFPEDSGDHKVEVFQAGTSEYKLIAEASVPSDCIEPQPENLITFGEWTTGEYECTDTTVQITRTVTSTEYVLVEGIWVPEGESVTTTQTETRDLTAEEIAELECPVVVPPTEEPPVVTPPVTTPPVTTPPATETPKPTPAPESGNLAQTGGDAAGFLTLAGLGALLSGAGYLLLRKRRTA